MRWIPALGAAAMLFAASAHADTYVKSESHTDGYYRGGMVIPAEDEVEEVWIGQGHMAYLTATQKIVIDLEGNTFVFVNLPESTFVETTLPLDQSKIFSEDEFSTLQIFKRRGTVEKREDDTRVETWKCAVYDLNDWMVYDESKLNERDVKLWATAEVTFDLDAYREMFAAIMRLSNLSDDYIEARQGIQGFQVMSEETTYTEGSAIKTTTTVTELSEKEPPADVYAVPEGYTKKDLLTIEDLRS